MRREGFARAAAEAGLAPEEVEVRGSGFYLEDGHAATLALLEAGEPPDAIVAANDPVAVGAIRALQERGLRSPRTSP